MANPIRVEDVPCKHLPIASVHHIRQNPTQSDPNLVETLFPSRPRVLALHPPPLVLNRRQFQQLTPKFDLEDDLDLLREPIHV